MDQEAMSESNVSGTSETRAMKTAENVMKAEASDEELSSSKLLAMPEVLSVVSGVQSGGLWRGFEAREVLRLILQTLDEMGYREVAASLEEASGVQLLQPEVRKLQRCILDGNWQEAGRALLRLPLEVLTRQACWFLLMQQKFLETLIEPNSSLEARLSCLRNDLSAAAFDSATTERVHECASLLMYQGNELTARALRLSSLCRGQLFNRVACLLPATLAMQPSRLATILSHARRFQVLCCPLHVESQCSSSESLVEPHRCRMPFLPQCCVGCLQAHQKEVWAIAVAPKLPNSTETVVASGAADNSVCVWLLSTDTSRHTRNSTAELDTLEQSPHAQLWRRWLAEWLENDGDSAMRHQLTQPLPMVEKGSIVGTCRLLWRVQRLTSAAAFLDWDSTNTLLAAGGETGFIEAWEEGRRIASYCTHRGTLVSLQWVRGSKRLISIGSDRTMSLVSLQQSSSLTLTHVVEYEWFLPARPQEGFLLPGEDSVMVFFADRQAKVFDLTTKQETFWVQGKDLVVAACASKLCNQILMSTANSPPVLRLWDLDERKVVQKYRGHKLGRLTIRPAFGGPAEELVISGSEDAQIYIWHRLWGCMLQQLKGHSAAVNQVVWIHSCGSLCLMSAGDDGVLLLWSAPAKTKSLTERGRGDALLRGDDHEALYPWTSECDSSDLGT